MRISARWVVSSIGVAVAGAMIAGCQYDPLAGFRQREAVVVFAHGTSQKTRMKIRADCAHVPHVVPEPVTHSTLKAARIYNVRYRIDQASDPDLAKLYACLQGHGSVLGVKIPSDM